MIKIKNKILFILGILLMLILFNPSKANAAGKYDLIIIGDSLTSQMYATYTGSWNQFVKSSTKINGKEVMMLGAGGYGHDYWFEQNYQDVKNALKNAKDGATCIIYLGGNDPGNYAKYPKSLNKMASEFTKVNFYFCSYPPSNGSSNTSINKFNNEVLNGLKKQPRYNKNLFYKEINDNELKIGTVKKTLYHFIMDNMDYMQDSAHFDLPLYKAVCEQIFLKMTKGSSSGTSGGSNNSGSGNKRPSGTGSYTIGVGDQGDREEVSFTDVLSDRDYYSDVGDIDADSKAKVEKTAGKALSVITNIGMVLSIIMPTLIGVKYMIFGNMEPRKDLVPYVVGAAILFSVCITTKIIYYIGKGINSI